MTLKQRLLLMFLLGPFDLLNFIINVRKVGFGVIECSCARLDEFFNVFEFLLCFIAHVLHLVIILTHSLLHTLLTSNDLSIC